MLGRPIGLVLLYTRLASNCALGSEELRDYLYIVQIETLCRELANYSKLDEVGVNSMLLVGFLCGNNESKLQLPE